MVRTGLLTTTDVDALTSSGGLPIVTAFTCLMGLYAVPGHDSLSEALAKRANGGAIAVWAPPTWRRTTESVRLAQLFAQSFFGSSHTVVLGDAIRAAQWLPQRKVCPSRCSTSTTCWATRRCRCGGEQGGDAR